MMIPEGSGSIGLAVMAEALGEQEEKEQLPLRPYAQAGSLFERALRMAGFSRYQLTLLNSVWCRPDNNKLDGEWYEQDAVESCYYYNDQVIERRKPGCILAMGNVPLRALTSFSGDACAKQSVAYLRGWVLPSSRYDTDGNVIRGHGSASPLPIVPTYHPSYIQRGAKELLGVFMHDIRLAAHIAHLGSPLGAEMPTAYQNTPSLDDALAFENRVRDAAGTMLSVDIETPWGNEHDDDEEPEGDTDIMSCQFSLAPYEGIKFPWTDPYIDVAKRILAMPNRKLGCNIWQFDLPILEAAGAPVREPVDDLRWRFHSLYPDLPANLQYICSFLSTRMKVQTREYYDERAAAEQPWKHTMGVQGGNYECKDVDLPLRAWAQLSEECLAQRCDNAYSKHIARVRPILLRATKHGIPVDRERWHLFGEKLDAALHIKNEECQGLYPENLLPVKPAGGYKNATIALKRMRKPNEGLDDKDLKWGKRWFKTETTGAYLPNTIAPSEERWCRIQRFMPNSPDHVLVYMRAKKHLVPRNKSGGETTGKLELNGLYQSTHDLLYKAVREYREISEMRGTHWKAWEPDSDDRVHPKFTFTPATGQLACYGGLNALNPPKPKGKSLKDELAIDFRRQIVARPGYRLWELDLKSAHALTLGFESRDLDYMRLSRIDVHSFVAAHLEGEHDLGLKRQAEQCLGWNDEQLAAFLKDVKKKYKATRDDRAKPSILGIGFGLQYRTLYRMNRESFARESDAKKVIDMIDALFPRMAKFRTSVRMLAQSQGFLLSRYGSIRWFYDVFHRDPYTGKMKSGEDSEAAIAFFPANDAFCYLKDVMIRLDGADKWLDRIGFLLQFHDALLFEMPCEYEDESIPIIYHEMTAPSATLIDTEAAPLGLSIGASISAGKDWASMEDVTL